MFDLTFRLHIHYHDPSFGAPKGRVHRINLSIFENIGLLVHIFSSLHSSLFSTIKFVCNRGGTMNTNELWRTIALFFVNDGQYYMQSSDQGSYAKPHATGVPNS